ncbi:unnamed protein product [Anisakis simplex]|uniref:Secreted protein n=1 Tax=Anisakis simplex TaxID=6269 RepID=A0A0M3K3M5_ANISI|nr:unnamed protein product [Anisakis simplex]
MCLGSMLLIFHSVTVILAQSSPCLLRCKDNNMNKVEKIIGRANDWTADLVAPMHSILRGVPEIANSRPHQMLVDRLLNICRANTEFEECVRMCDQTIAAKIVLKGQTAWINICNAFRSNQGGFTSDILPCWSRHGAEIGKRCSLHATMVQNAVLDLIDNGIQSIDQHVADLCK